MQFPLIVKPWGTSQSLFRDHQAELVRINVNPHSRCSRHYHRSKDNSFMVLRGTLKVTIYVGGPKDATTEHLLTPEAAPLNVARGTQHRFETLDGECLAMEFYKCLPGFTVEQEDIVRLED